jgi:hypothetical protein
MAKKLLISDTKLGWIKDTRSGADKSPGDKIIAKAEKPAAQSTTAKNSLLPEALIKATETVNRTEAKKPSKPKAASKIGRTPKHPLDVKTSLVASSPNKPLDRTPRKRQKIEPEPQLEEIELAPQPEIAHESQAKASLFHQTYEAALAPIVEKPAVPIAEIPFTPKEALTEEPTLNKLPYVLSIVALISVALLLPERYRIFVFLGFIFIALLEVSYRVRKQYCLLRSISESRNVWQSLLSKK